MLGPRGLVGGRPLGDGEQQSGDHRQSGCHPGRKQTVVPNHKALQAALCPGFAPGQGLYVTRKLRRGQAAVQQQRRQHQPQQRRGEKADLGQQQRQIFPKGEPAMEGLHRQMAQPGVSQPQQGIDHIPDKLAAQAFAHRHQSLLLPLGVGVQLPRPAGAVEVEIPGIADIFPAAAGVKPAFFLLGGLVAAGGGVQPVADRARLPFFKPGEIKAAFFHKQTPSGHFFKVFLPLGHRPAGQRKAIAALHSISTSACSPSATIRRRRSYSWRRACRPAGVRA